MKPSKAFARALAMFNGSPTAMAAEIGGKVQRQHIEYWRANGVPRDQRPHVERVTNGTVTCEDLTDGDAEWLRVADSEWPWHPDGRPYLDVSKVAA